MFQLRVSVPSPLPPFSVPSLLVAVLCCVCIDCCFRYGLSHKKAVKLVEKCAHLVRIGEEEVEGEGDPRQVPRQLPTSNWHLVFLWYLAHVI